MAAICMMICCGPGACGSDQAVNESNKTMPKARWSHAEALRKNDSTTLDDLRESVKTLEGTLRIARRTLGSTLAHPLTAGIANELKLSRAALRARELSPQVATLTALATTTRPAS